jgi:hypothetical protein
MEGRVRERVCVRESERDEMLEGRVRERESVCMRESERDEMLEGRVRGRVCVR